MTRLIAAGVSGDPLISRRQKVQGQSPVVRVATECGRDRWGSEFRERREESKATVIVVDQLLKEVEIHVAREVIEDCEEVGVWSQRVSERAAFAEIVAPDKFKGEIESVLDLWVGSATLTPCGVSIIR